MYKDCIIAALGAALAIKGVPYFAACGPAELAALFLGIFVPLLFFCIFCDCMAEKWHGRERDRRQLAEYIRRLGREE